MPNEVARRPVQQPAARQAPAPGSRHEMILFARELATAGNLPRIYQNNPGAILVIQEYAATLGIPFLTAVTQVNIIEGKPSSSAILIKSLVRKAGHRIRSGHGEDGMSAWCSIWTKQDPDFEYRAEWDLATAERAGLLRVVNGNIVSKGKSGAPTNWEKNPRVMLAWRALTECAREAVPEDLLGLYTPDELGYEVSDDGRVTAYADQSTVVDPAPEPADPVIAAVDEAVASGGDVASAALHAHEKELTDALIAAERDAAEWDELISSCEKDLDVEGLRALHGAVRDEPDAALLRSRINAAGIRVRGRLDAGETPPEVDVDKFDVTDPDAQPATDADEVVDGVLVEETPEPAE